MEEYALELRFSHRVEGTHQTWTFEGDSAESYVWAAFLEQGGETYKINKEDVPRDIRRRLEQMGLRLEDE